MKGTAAAVGAVTVIVASQKKHVNVMRSARTPFVRRNLRRAEYILHYDEGGIFILRIEKCE
jgi:hypothetical protein